MPESHSDLHAVYDDHLYFFVIATRQALKAVWVLEQRGEDMPEFRQGDKLRAWRDFEEHWDAEGRDLGYARYYVHPGSKSTLRAWIEDAYTARTSRASLIDNTRARRQYSATCP
jgi:hypothetical protein